MANYKTGAQRYNDRMDKIFATARQTERERLARGEEHNPNLSSKQQCGHYHVLGDICPDNIPW